MEESRTFTLSFRLMITWCLTLLLVCAGAGLAVALVLGLGFYFLSGLKGIPLSTPIMLAVIPVLLLIGLFIPVILLLAFMFSRFMKYEIGELGLTQSFGPVKHEVDWLRVESVQDVEPLKLYVINVHVFKKDQPVTIYAGFLADPPGFIDAIDRFAPKDNPMRQWLYTVHPERDAEMDRES